MAIPGRENAMKSFLSTLVAGASLALFSAGQALAGAVAQIPEPSSFALIASGAAVVAWAKFRRGR
jgi:hypothetical protein